MRLAALVLTTACMMDHGGEVPDPGDHANALQCDASMTLDASTDTTSSQLSLVPDSVGWCLHLDGTADQHAAPVLFVQTSNVDGTHSDIDLTVLDATGSTLQTGWDVTVGHGSSDSFAELQWQMTSNEVVDVILRSRAYPPRDATVTAELMPGLD